MRKAKRFAAMFLTSVMIVSSLTGCGKQEEIVKTTEDVKEGNVPVDENGNPSAFGRYKEPITVSIVQQVNATDVIPEGQTATDNQYTRYVKDTMNVDVEVKWQAAAGDDFTQKVNLAIASNDLPDVMVVREAQFRELVKADLIEDLTPYYDVYASDTIKEIHNKTDGMAMDAVTYDGKIMALPGVQVEMDGYNLMWIRQDWLDELNLEAPKTVEDLEKVALAFVENKMGGDQTVGIVGPTANNILYHNFLESINGSCTVDAIFHAYKAYPGFWIEKDGKAVYGSITEETKQGLAKLRDMYASGALDPELGTRKDSGEVWKSGKGGIFFGPWWMGYGGIKDAVKNDLEASWVAYALPLSEDGSWNPRMGTSTQEFTVVRKGYEHPELAFLLANYLVRDAGKMDTTALGPSYYPARSVLAALDESTFSVEVLRKALNLSLIHI